MQHGNSSIPSLSGRPSTLPLSTSLKRGLTAEHTCLMIEETEWGKSNYIGTHDMHDGSKGAQYEWLAELATMDVHTTIPPCYHAVQTKLDIEHTSLVWDHISLYSTEKKIMVMADFHHRHWVTSNLAVWSHSHGQLWTVTALCMVRISVTTPCDSTASSPSDCLCIIIHYHKSGCWWCYSF